MSEWLIQYEKQIEDIKKQKRKNYRKICLFVGVILIGFLLINIIGHANQMGYMVLAIVTFTAVMILGTVYGACYRKGDPNLRKYFRRNLSTKEEIDQFDEEMMSEPLSSIKLQNKDGEIKLMAHYMSQHITRGSSPLLHYYAIIKLEDLASIEIYINRTQKRVDREFTFVCKDRRNRGMGTLVVYCRRDYIAVKEAISSLYPEYSKMLTKETYYDEPNEG